MYVFVLRESQTTLEILKSTCEKLFSVQTALNLLEIALSNVTALHAKLEWGPKKKGRSFISATSVRMCFRAEAIPKITW